MARIDKFFHMMIDEKASDLHLTANNVPRLRVHGEMKPIEGESVINAEQMLALLMEIAPERNKQEFLQRNDTDFAYELEGAGRFRTNIFRDISGPGAVFRIIPSEVITAEQLGLTTAVIDMCYLSKGLVLVTGPTGSGKSTTLSAMIDFINKNRKEHVITIEDPIEFVHKNINCLINQREINSHTDSFKIALRAALRQDPDIVLIGEMRDLETTEIAIETAETGHLVLATLHTSTAASTVERIIQQFPGEKQNQIRQMLANSLKGVISQTLLRKKDGKGRVAAQEILVVNSAVSSQIREGKTHQINSSIQIGGNEGMVILNDALIKLIKSNTVGAEEAYLKSIDKLDFKNRLTEMGIMSLDKGEFSKQTDTLKKKLNSFEDDMGTSFMRKR